MLTDNNVFKTKSEIPSQESIPAGKIPASTPTTSDVEVPYRDYETASGHPYIVEYFGLGDGWNERQGGFEQEINTISDYIDEQINIGELANTISGVKRFLKDIEKLNNIKDEERVFVKTEVLANYIEFMKKKQETFERVGRIERYARSK